MTDSTGRDDPATPDDSDPAAVMAANWRDDVGYTSPNPTTYPWQWLWDSCFHVLIWAELGRQDRALRELDSVFDFQRPNGFVPHINFTPQPTAALQPWGITGSSTITQPPMHAHAAAALSRRGVDVPDHVTARIGQSLEHLWLSRRHRNGLLTCLHPWEIADDSPRWDDWGPRPFDRFGTWRARKFELVTSLVLDDQDAAISNPEFEVQSAAFNALVAFNLGEYAWLTGLDRWEERARTLAADLDDCWDAAARTWVDQSDDAVAGQSSRVRTLDALLPLLVTERDDVDGLWDDLSDPDRYGAEYGPCGVRRDEPTFDPDGYWRGAAWPQLHYLLSLAARRHGHEDLAVDLQATTRAIATSADHPEYWNPITGDGLGAAPQSWAALWIAMPGGAP